MAARFRSAWLAPGMSGDFLPKLCMKKTTEELCVSVRELRLRYFEREALIEREESEERFEFLLFAFYRAAAALPIAEQLVNRQTRA